MAEADILEDPLLQETSERPKKALREVNKARLFQNTVQMFYFLASTRFFLMNKSVESLSFFLACCQDETSFQPSNHFTTHKAYSQT